MMVLDTSFLVSLVLSQDMNHSQALDLFASHRTEEMLLTDTILFETLSVLNRKEGITAAKTAYAELLANSKLILIYSGEDERREIIAEFLEQDDGLSVADISVVHACKKTMSPALSFDRKLLKKIGK